MTDRKLYRVREGVEWVNGARVSATRIVELTEAEARFDLEQGRIEPGADGNLSSEMTALEAPVSVAEPSIVRGARRGKRRFKLSEGE